MQNNAAETARSSTRRSSGSSGSSQSRKEKKNQFPISFGVLLTMIIIGLLLDLKNDTLASYQALGCCFGFILQKSRFCFIAPLGNPCTTGSTFITRAVLVAFAVITIGFTAIKHGAFVNGQGIPGQSYTMSISLTTAVGGIMFGISMVTAGGCAPGALMHVGEGFAIQMLNFLLSVTGSLTDAGHMGWWIKSLIVTVPRIFPPDVFGQADTVVLQLVITRLLYIAADLYERKRTGNTKG